MSSGDFNQHFLPFNLFLRSELLAGFARTNTCEACYTGLRANSEKPAYWLVKDAVDRL